MAQSDDKSSDYSNRYLKNSDENVSGKKLPQNDVLKFDGAMMTHTFSVLTHTLSVFTHTHTYTFIGTYTHSNTHTHKHTHTYMHTLTQTHSIHSTHTHIPTSDNTQTTQTHTHTHTHTHNKKDEFQEGPGPISGVSVEASANSRIKKDLCHYCFSLWTLFLSVNVFFLSFFTILYF